jgi:RNA polymerase sigma-70 factor, ECF subfamily
VDPDDFQALYRQELNYVWDTLRRFGVHPSDLEDLTHEVFVTAFQKRSEFDSTRPLRPWLGGIAFRVAAKTRRGQRAREVESDEMDVVDRTRGPEELLLASEDRRILLAALRTLSEDRRAIFILHDVDGSSAPDIAAALRVPLNTVYSRLRLARDQMAREIASLREGSASP